MLSTPRIIHKVSYTTCYLIVFVLVTACTSSESTRDAENDEDAGDGELDTKRSANEFVSLKITSGGGMCCPECGDCCDCQVVMRGVESPNLLILRDAKAEGQFTEERFELDEKDYQDVLSMVLSPEFVSAIHDPEDCSTVTDLTSIVSIEWTDVGILSDTLAASCIALAFDEPDHVYARLWRLLIKLQLKFVDCPQTDPGVKSPLRPLCSGCFVWKEDPCTINN